jgi:hypothetical protein
LIGTLVLIFNNFPTSEGIIAYPDTFAEYQPDGSPITLRLRGDERRNWITDTEDCLVVKIDDGTFVYVTEEEGGNATSSKLVPSSDYIVGQFNPNDSTSGGRIKLVKYPLFENEACSESSRICGGIYSKAVAETTTHRSNNNNIFSIRNGNERRNLRGYQQHSNRHLLTQDPGPHYHRQASALPSTGTIRNLVILVQFGDHMRARRPLPTVSEIEDHMESVKQFFIEGSFGNLVIESTVVPTWYTTSLTEAWYADSSSGYVYQLCM